MATTFTAKYDGRCAAACGRRIESGDDVIYVDEVLVHDECALGPVDGILPEPVKREVCTTCFTEVAVNGSCAC